MNAELESKLINAIANDPRREVLPHSELLELISNEWDIAPHQLEDVISGYYFNSLSSDTSTATTAATTLGCY